MPFPVRDDLETVFVTFADTAAFDPATKRHEPRLAGFVCVLKLPPADRDALLDLLPDEWGERVRLIFSQVVCDENGVPPGEVKLAEVFGRLDLPTTEKVHRACCAWNQIPYMEFPRDPVRA